ncbi:hypothetical protein H2200_004978 [Cladophialophora chaetospira]|uniref:BTB domain-containing protein n=1 Tax=Cladophialophora chaetospira TaxID=386627 RepID=A0AA39CJD2_9EURO|nr:hypothetical protein H2200_004978 [Cladophialophora chaetospira]
MTSTDPSSSKKRKLDEMESSMSSTSTIVRNARVVEIIPGADVTLQVGDAEDALDIKASGLVLGLVSKVFQVMLNSQFIEGSTKTIKMTQDDPQIMLDFCRIVHHQYGSVKDLSAKRLRGLIQLADMRDCREALKPWLSSVLEEHTMWIDRWWGSCFSSTDDKKFPTSIPGLLLEDILAFAYIFELPDLFGSATSVYLALAGSPDQAIFPSEGLPESAPLPVQSGSTCFYELLKQIRESRIQLLSEKVIECVSEKLHSGRSYTSIALSKRVCKSVQQKYGAFLYWLTMEGFTLNGKYNGSKSWSSLLAYVGMMADLSGCVSTTGEEESAMEKSGLGKVSSCKSSQCQYCTRDVQAALRKLVVEFRDDASDIACPRCFRESGEFCAQKACEKHQDDKEKAAGLGES